jgi:riboflavin synthase
MFTGIIETVGHVLDVTDTHEFRRIRVHAGSLIDGVGVGASIATNGVCITATTVEDGAFTADLSRETLARTTFGDLETGRRVNLELSMRADARFGGHIVQGHVDGVGTIRRFDRNGDDWVLEVGFSPEHARRLVWKGSVAVDGISLTVAALESDWMSFAIIPFTLENTNLGSARPGDRVNLEFDVLAKYVERMLEPYVQSLGRGNA